MFPVQVTGRPEVVRETFTSADPVPILRPVSATEVIAVIALAVSTASAVAAGLSLYLGFRESSRRDEEIRLLRDEAGRRDEELSLLREQVAAEEAERRRAQQAQIVIAEGGVPTSGSE